MTICYFGIYQPEFSRNNIYMRGLREQGVEVLECRDTSSGLRKYWRLWKKHRALPAYDAMIVGYPGHLVVPFAKFLSKKPVIADLLGSLADAEVHSHHPSFLRRLKARLVDWFAVRFADVLLLETEAQKQFFINRFGPSSKYRVLYTGADDSVFRCDKEPQKEPMVVLFRGKLTPESGIGTILQAALLLKDERTIRFCILASGGALLSETKTTIRERGLTNVELVEGFLSDEMLRASMCDASLSLGQFEDNPRLSRTIPHKAFESFAMGIPYLSGDAPGIREMVREGETGFLVPLADSNALAAKIKKLDGDRAALSRAGMLAKEEFQAQFSPAALGRSLQLIASESRRIG